MQQRLVFHVDQCVRHMAVGLLDREDKPVIEPGVDVVRGTLPVRRRLAVEKQNRPLMDLSLDIGGIEVADPELLFVGLKPGNHRTPFASSAARRRWICSVCTLSFGSLSTVRKTRCRTSCLVGVGIDSIRNLPASSNPVRCRT